ncbi:MAG: hypothetical protein IT341_07040 [Chloroflexi bacterium]|nr:hypothetical protein [Chloroflexota bacterium]
MAKTIDKNTVLVRITAGAGGTGSVRTNVWLGDKLGLGLSQGYLLTGAGTRMSRADAVALLVAARNGHPNLSGRAFAADEDLAAAVDAAVKAAEAAKEKAAAATNEDGAQAGAESDTAQPVEGEATTQPAETTEPAETVAPAAAESATPRARHQR